MSPKEIAEHILEFEPDYGTDFTGLARAYLELGNDYKEQGKLICRMGIRDMNQIEEITKLKEENEKLKKSREVLRSAFEVIARGESQFDNVDHMYTAREALKADDEIMGGK